MLQEIQDFFSGSHGGDPVDVINHVINNLPSEFKTALLTVTALLFLLGIIKVVANLLS